MSVWPKTLPVTPSQIYHDAALVYHYADGREQTMPITLVEFPAYENHLDEVRRALQAYGFPSDCIHTVGMLDDIQSDLQKEAAPEGAPYVSRYRMKHRAAAV
jgi:hypothetical protein